MDHGFTNRRRNLWAVSLLDVQRGDRVLEIGFGPGIAVREVSRLAVDGYVCGLDHSGEMLRQAARRNAAAIRTGHVDLRLGSFERLPQFMERFDKVLAVNTMMFWTQPTDRLKELRRAMRPGGVIAIAHQPRGPGASDAVAAARGEGIAAGPYSSWILGSACTNNEPQARRGLRDWSEHIRSSLVRTQFHLLGSVFRMIFQSRYRLIFLTLVVVGLWIALQQHRPTIYGDIPKFTDSQPVRSW